MKNRMKNHEQAELRGASVRRSAPLIPETASSSPFDGSMHRRGVSYRRRDRGSAGHIPLIAGAVAILAALAVPASAAAQSDRISADLQSRRESTRISAVRALGGSADPDAPGLLAPAILDLSNAVQLEAIDAVMTMVLAPPPDSRTAKTVGSRTGTMAADLFEAGPLAVLPRALPESIFLNLAASLRDDDPRVRGAAAAALGVLGGSQAIGDELRGALVNDFVYGMQQPDAPTRAAIARTAGVLFAMPDPGEPPAPIGDALIATMNDPDERVRIAAMDALGWLRERRAAQALADRAVFYRKGDEALAALHALSRVAQARWGDVFRARLAAPDRAVRVVAIEGLGRMGDRESVSDINRMLQRESDPAVLLAGAFAFYRLGEPGNLDRIIAGLTMPDTVRQARAYVTELCPDAAPRLEQHLQQPDPRVRQAASEMLGLCGRRASQAALEIASRDPDRAAAEAARQGLIRLRTLPAGVRLH